MSNPITGAYIESQDKKSRKPLQEDASQKMGLEALMSVPGAFVNSAFEAGIQTPVNGLMQLRYPHEANALKVVTTHKAEMGTAEWFAQLAGSAVGSFGNYWLLSNTLRLCKPIAHLMDKAEKSNIGNFATAAGTGAFYGGILTPVNPESENMAWDRFKNAGVGAASVAALIAPNRIRLGNNAIADGHGSRANEFLTTATGGLLAGMTNIGTRSVLDGKAMNGRDAAETMLAYSLLGLGYGAYRAGGRTERQMELKQEDMTDKLLTVRRTLSKPKPSKENDSARPSKQEMDNATKQMDQNIRAFIRDSQLPLDTQLELIKLHRTEFSRLLSNPLTNRVPERFIDHEYDIQGLVINAIKQEQAALSRQIEQSVTRQALNRWTRKPAEETSGEEVKYLPAKVDQSNQSTSQLPANVEKMSDSTDVQPNGQSSVQPDAQAAGVRDLSPQGPFDLRSGFLGQRIEMTKLEMANRNSKVAKRANMNTARPRDQQPYDLAETFCVTGLSGKLKLKHTTFEKHSYTAEQANRKAIVDKITPASEETASGIGDWQELNKSTAKPWNNQQDESQSPGI